MRVEKKLKRRIADVAAYLVGALLLLIVYGAAIWSMQS